MKPSPVCQIFLACLLGSALIFGSSQSVEATRGQAVPAPQHANLARLSAAVEAQGSLPVIVRLNTTFQPETSLSGAQVEAQRATLQQIQGAVLENLTGAFEASSVKEYTFIPAMALRVNAKGLAALAADPNVAQIEEDIPQPPALAESVPLIGAPAVWTLGFSGQGQTVAILDTGVDKTHPFLASKVVAEACFSTTYADYGSVSLCPGGVVSTSPGAAMPYASGVCPSTQCDHGTHVAGIVAGRATPTFAANGVAKDATLIAIQVFSKFPGSYSSCKGNDCILSYPSDQISGMQWVYNLRASYNIAAINMSLGSGGYTSQAACDSDNTDMKAAIDVLRAVGIATVIASGNDYYSNALAAPGCISTAISVGSVQDGTPATPAIPVDEVVRSSNSASYLNLLAPGKWITSSIPGGSYTTLGGTSMATPHVAGAWAVLKSKFPAASVTQILNLLTSTGKPVTDTRNGLVKPRIQLNQAINGPLSITGKITTDGAAGLAGVTVSAGNGIFTTTNANGIYTLAGLIEGTYTLTPTRSEFTFTPPSRSVALGPSAAGIDFTGVPNSYSASGRITLSTGFGAPGVTVSAGPGLTATTDAWGYYTLPGLVTGTYTLTPSKPPLYTAFAPASRTLTVGPNQTAVNFVGTTPLYSVTGKVSTAAAAPIAGVMVEDGFGRLATTDAAGIYTLTGLPAGAYTMILFKVGYIFTPNLNGLNLSASQSNLNFTGAPGGKTNYLPMLTR